MRRTDDADDAGGFLTSRRRLLCQSVSGNIWALSAGIATKLGPNLRTSELLAAKKIMVATGDHRRVVDQSFCSESALDKQINLPCLLSSHDPETFGHCSRLVTAIGTPPWLIEFQFIVSNCLMLS